jgi:hypothetical protein
MCPGKPPRNIKEALQFIARVGAKNLHLAPSIGMLLAEKTSPNDIANLFKDKLGLWLASTPEFDISGHLWNVNAPFAGGDWKHNLADFLSIVPEAPVVLDAVYKNQDEEYLDACVLDRILH